MTSPQLTTPLRFCTHRRQAAAPGGSPWSMPPTFNPRRKPLVELAASITVPRGHCLRPAREALPGSATAAPDRDLARTSSGSVQPCAAAPQLKYEGFRHIFVLVRRSGGRGHHAQSDRSGQSQGPPWPLRHHRRCARVLRPNCWPCSGSWLYVVETNGRSEFSPEGRRPFSWRPGGPAEVPGC